MFKGFDALLQDDEPLRVLAIDSGTIESGWVILDARFRILDGGFTRNQELCNWLWENVDKYDVCAIEMLQSYGSVVGETTFTTGWWTGRFWEAAYSSGHKTFGIYRANVKHVFCGSSASNDADVNERCRQIWGDGSKTGKGTKEKPGQLYGLNGHQFAALAVAYAYLKAPAELHNKPFLFDPLNYEKTKEARTKVSMLKKQKNAAKKFKVRAPPPPPASLTKPSKKKGGKS